MPRCDPGSFESPLILSRSKDSGLFVLCATGGSTSYDFFESRDEAGPVLSLPKASKERDYQSANIIRKTLVVTKPLEKNRLVGLAR